MEALFARARIASTPCGQAERREEPQPFALPEGARLRIVGDVHGDARGFAAAAIGERFVVQLGDLTDHGPDSAGALRTMLALIEAGRGLFLLGNHDLKLARALAGRQVRRDPPLTATLASLDPELAARAGAAIARAPAWLVSGRSFFVHAAFDVGMLLGPPPPAPIERAVPPLVARALYGQPTGRMQPDGYPERSLRWVDRIPAGLTVYCGHDCRSRDGRPYVRRNEAGGVAVFLDTGAGKGGHLSWIDL
ncbi:MAG TPA: metallophosphoesterase [Acetobacteraceae bacterium]|nr:metallophosphoesterase [Acetobacteraceae bacterium]